MTLTEFLLARIAEDEKIAGAAIHARGYAGLPNEPDTSMVAMPDSPVPSVLIGPERVLAECEAKRRIVAEHPHTFREGDGWLVGDEWHCDRCMPEYWYWCVTLRVLALPYADHPDYQSEWAA